MIWPYVALYLAGAVGCYARLRKIDRDLGIVGVPALDAVASILAWWALAFAWSARRVARWGRK